MTWCVLGQIIIIIIIISVNVFLKYLLLIGPISRTLNRSFVRFKDRVENHGFSLPAKQRKSKLGKKRDLDVPIFLTSVVDELPKLP